MCFFKIFPLDFDFDSVHRTVLKQILMTSFLLFYSDQTQWEIGQLQNKQELDI